MTLQETAAAVGHSPRWVLNALTRLKVPRRYGEPLARRLCIARLLSVGLKVPLPDAWQLASQALAGDLSRPWHWQSDGLRLEIDLPRVLGAYAARLAAARNAGPRTRGRRPARSKSAVARAREWGTDLTLFESTLNRTMADRLGRAATSIDVLRQLRGSAAR